MIKRWDKAFDRDEVLGLLDPLIREWFEGKFKDLAPPQRYAVPLIHEGRNVLITSPTGSGKTLTAFLSIINELFLLAKNGTLEDRVYCLYVSPLKALANDIERNLNEPLREIAAMAEEEGLKPPGIRVAVRSGDTSVQKRQRMARKPPHILITTPETLGIVLSTRRFRDHLKGVRYVIVDEIHELCSSKRGVMLSLNLERLEELKENSGFMRIGLSATQAPITEIARFLAGYDDNGKIREMNIVDISARKSLDMAVLTPSKDLNFTPYEIVNAQMYMMLKDYIEGHRTTLIFTNTRSGTEAVVYRLKELGLESIGAHHGSLSKDIRLDVEERMKRGEIRAVASSTSLELGIDIGSIDLVVQIGSPKSIAKGIQRIGRSGHKLHETSKGRIIVFDRDDLMESAVIVNCAMRGKIDRTHILKGSLDVLAQVLVGMSLEKRWGVDEAYKVIKRSYNYHTLKKADFLRVLEFLGKRGSLEDWGVYSKLWYSPKEGVFGIKRGVRQIYNLNIGTIPQESSYDVIMYKNNIHVGSLSEKFVERLRSGDIFVLGGRSFEFIRVRGTKVYVRDAMGRRPTVPSWAGEMLPRSFDLSVEVGRFRAMLLKTLEKGRGKALLEKLMQEYRVDESGARTIVNYIKEQAEFTRSVGGRPMVPTHKNVLIEGYVDNKGKHNIIFHYCFGRRVNDALSRAYAYVISRRYNTNVAITLSDDNFMLTLDRAVPLNEIPSLLGAEDLEVALRAAIRNTELFKQRFRHCAVRSFMILRNYKGREISIRKQHRRAQKVIDLLLRDEEFPVVKETYNEILHDAMDMDNALKILRDIKDGKIAVETMGYNDVPSPMAHNVVLMGYSDVILMEDKAQMLKTLHMSVLERVKGISAEVEYEFQPSAVEEYFSHRTPSIAGEDDLIELIKGSTGLHIFRELPPSIYPHSRIPRDQLDRIAMAAIDKGEIVSVYKRPSVVYVHRDDVPIFYTLYADRNPLSEDERKALEAIRENNGVVPRGIDRALLRGLERKYAVYRLYPTDADGRLIYRVRDTSALMVDEKGRDECLEALCKRALYRRGPSTIEEVAYALGLGAEETKALLKRMTDRGVVAEGNFVFGKDIPQYMLMEDRVAMSVGHRGGYGRVEKASKTRGNMGIDPKVLEDFRSRWVLAKAKGIEDYINRFLGIISPRSVFLRDNEFALEDMYRMLYDGRLIAGRFIGGFVSFTTPAIGELFMMARMEDIFDNPQIAGAYIAIAEHWGGHTTGGTSNPGAEIKSAKGGSGATVGDVARYLGVEVSEAKDVIKALERACFIVRDPLSTVGLRKGLTNMNRYRPYNPISKDIPKPETIVRMLRKRMESGGGWEKGDWEVIAPEQRLKAVEDLTVMFLEGFGPSTISDIAQYLHIPESMVREALSHLTAKGKLHELTTKGGFRYYSLQTKGYIMEHSGGEGGGEWLSDVEIVPFYDPYSFLRRGEMTLRFGEGWISPVIDHGRIVGFIEAWPMSGVLDIRRISLKGEGVVGAVLGPVLERWMRYYRQYNIHAIRVRMDAIPEDEREGIRMYLEKAGYVSCPQGYYAKGVRAHAMDSKAIVNIVLYYQRIHPGNKFINALEALQYLGGVRSEFPLSLRVRSKVYDLHELARHFRLLGGKLIPSFFMFTSIENLDIYRKAKGHELDKNMTMLLEQLPASKPVTITHMKRITPMAEKQLIKTKKALYDALYIAKTPNNQYVKVSEAKPIDPEEIRAARKELIKRVFEVNGILTPEEVSRYLNHEISMYEIRSILDELVDNDVLVRGFFNKDNDYLYYALPEALSVPIYNIGPGKWVLTSDDPFYSYIYPEVHDRFNVGTCNVVMDGIEPVGIFKADIRRHKGGGRGFVRYMTVYETAGWGGVDAVVEQFARIHGMVLRWEKAGAEGGKRLVGEGEAIYDSVYEDEVYEDY